MTLARMDAKDIDLKKRRTRYEMLRLQILEEEYAARFGMCLHRGQALRGETPGESK